MSKYTKVNELTKEEIEIACKQSRCFRQANSLCKVHLEDIKLFVERVNKENIDVSHFNKNEIKCSQCGSDYTVMTVLDFDDVGRQFGRCLKCNTSEWIKDGGDIIDGYHYFTEGYKSKQMLIIGHTDI